MPTGISDGRSAMRAMTSAPIRNAAPSRIDIGRGARRARAIFVQGAVLKLPRTTEKTESVFDVFWSMRYEVIAVASEERATPARINVVAGTVLPTRATP